MFVMEWRLVLFIYNCYYSVNPDALCNRLHGQHVTL